MLLGLKVHIITMLLELVRSKMWTQEECRYLNPSLFKDSFDSVGRVSLTASIRTTLG